MNDESEIILQRQLDEICNEFEGDWSDSVAADFDSYL